MHRADTIQNILPEMIRKCFGQENGMLLVVNDLECQICGRPIKSKGEA
jgi:hypothetical protein